MSCNSRNSDRVEEDGPQYRSVAIMSPMAPPPAMKFAALPKKEVLGTVSSYSLSKPVQSAKSCKWTVKDATPLPPYYLLERSNVYVKDTTPQDCAQRISDCLRSINIAQHQVSDDNLFQESSSRNDVLRVETHDGVKFAVRLFSDQGMVVVEVQRTAGCSFGFREASRAVLRAAKGSPSESAAKASSKRKFAIPPALSPRSNQVVESCIRDDFEMALIMLQSDRFDSQLLALDCMEDMTKSCGLVGFAAKLVLGNDCVERLVSLLAGQDTSTTTRKVLAVLANAFSALESADLAVALSSSDHLKDAAFLSILLSSLRDASEKPHDAYQAVRCLKFLLISKEVENIIVDMSGMEVVQLACSAGCNYHHALEQESETLMSQLRDVCC